MLEAEESGFVVVEDGARRGGRGRKLHAEAERMDTRWKIWDKRDCWVAVSCSFEILESDNFFLFF